MADHFRLMSVHVPAATSRFFTVPEYEVLPIVTLWQHFTLPNMAIEVSWTGATVEAQGTPQEEYDRINANYRTPEGKGIADIAFGGVAMFAQHAKGLLLKREGPLNRLLAGEDPAAVVPPPPPTAKENEIINALMKGEEVPPGPAPLDASEIEAMKIDHRARRALIEAGMTKAVDVLNASDDELVDLPYITHTNLPAVRAEAQRIFDAAE